MEYNLTNQHGDELASGLSEGELAGYLFELHNELDLMGKHRMRKSLGFRGMKSKFEDFLWSKDYENEVPLTFPHGIDIITITEEEW